MSPRFVRDVANEIHILLQITDSHLHRTTIMSISYSEDAGSV